MNLMFGKGRFQFSKSPFSEKFLEKIVASRDFQVHNFLDIKNVTTSQST